MTDLGKLLNTIDNPINPCPGCRTTEPMQVHEHAIRWKCGHITKLPPIGATHGLRPAGQITQRVKR